jgi:hypothetical protein
LNWHVEFTPHALEDLSHLDAPVARRIADKIQWLAEHVDQIQPETPTFEPDATYRNHPARPRMTSRVVPVVTPFSLGFMAFTPTYARSGDTGVST